MKACRLILIATLLSLTSTNFIAKGVVEISPSGVAPVCQAGDQLELTCSTPGFLQTWQFIAVSKSGVAMTFTRSVSSGGPTGVDSQPLIINSTIVFTFSRLSSQNNLPLISRMTIHPVNEDLNGTRVNCLDSKTSESATTTIHIIIGDTYNQGLSIESHSEQFTRGGVIVVLEWIFPTSRAFYKQLPIAQNVSINVVPEIWSNAVLVFPGNTSVILILQYNTLYNVSITQPGICGQSNLTAYIELNYSKCSNPMKFTHYGMIVEGYEDPALEGENITLICSPGSMLTGPNSSTCMRNGEWEPHPKDVACTGVHDPGLAMLRTVLISVAVALVMMSVLMFIIGFISCGHYFHKRWRKSANENDGAHSNPITEPEEGLALKKNVAYIHLDPEYLNITQSISTKKA